MSKRVYLAFEGQNLVTDEGWYEQLPKGGAAAGSAYDAAIKGNRIKVLETQCSDQNLTITALMSEIDTLRRDRNALVEERHRLQHDLEQVQEALRKIEKIVTPFDV